MPLKLRFVDLVSGFGVVLRRFPLAVATTLVAYGCCLGLLENLAQPLQSQIVPVLMVCALALPSFFALALRREQSARTGLSRYGLETFGLVLLLAYGLWLQALPENLPFKHIVRYGLLILAVHFFVACAPFLARSHRDGFWNYNKTLFLRYLLGALYSAVLFAGLALAMFSVDRLLSLKINSDNYGRLFFGIVTIFHPAFFLAGISRDFTQPSDLYPTGLRRFIQFCLVPLVVIYLTILYLYTAKIIFSWELPNGWVALPVLILSVIGILSSLLLDPLREDREFPWAGVFIPWFYRLLLPLTILLMISIGVRIADYGVTENRYFVAILALWLLIVAAGYGWLSMRSTRWIPISLGALCLLSAFGPWSASTVSLRSQQHRLMNELQNLGVVADGHFIAKPQTIAAATYTGLRSRLQYLFQYHDPHLLDPMMAEFPNWSEGYNSTSFNRYGTEKRADRLLYSLGINSGTQDRSPYSLGINSGPQTQSLKSYTLQTTEPFAVRTGGMISLHHKQFWGTSMTAPLLPDGKLTITLNVENETVLKTDKEAVVVSWLNLFNTLRQSSDQEDLPHYKLTQSIQIGDHRVNLTATEVRFTLINGQPKIESFNLLVIVYPR